MKAYTLSQPETFQESARIPLTCRQGRISTPDPHRALLSTQWVGLSGCTWQWLLFHSQRACQGQRKLAAGAAFRSLASAASLFALAFLACQGPSPTPAGRPRARGASTACPPPSAKQAPTEAPFLLFTRFHVVVWLLNIKPEAQGLRLLPKFSDLFQNPGEIDPTQSVWI